MPSLGNESRTVGTKTWLTPPWLLRHLGEFDLDPCAAIGQPWQTAKKQYTELEDGLSQTWEGRVWLNPPYGASARDWLKKMAEHRNGIALLFARTDTKTFQEWVLPHAKSAIFLAGRVKFHDMHGVEQDYSGAPSVLLGYGDDGKFLQNCAVQGKFVWLN